MRIVLLGSLGSGKGTQAQFISEKYNIQKISAGDILRSEVISGSKLGLRIKKFMEIGVLLPDKLIINLIKKIKKLNFFQSNFVLDGFPRTIFQAKAMKKLKIFFDYVLEIDVSDDLVFERISGRRIHISSGRTYHVKYNPPRVEDRDDLTGEKLSIRSDDRIEVIKKRLLEYHKFTKPLVEYYKNEASSSGHVLRYFKLDGRRGITEVNNKMIDILKK